jgi:hypothetical protein
MSGKEQITNYEVPHHKIFSLLLFLLLSLFPTFLKCNYNEFVLLYVSYKVSVTKFKADLR